MLSLFGTALAGYIGFLWNYFRLGYMRKLYFSLTVGAVFFLLLFWLAVSLPRTSFDRTWPALVALLMFCVANVFQGKLIKQQMLDGAKKHSIWAVLFLIILTLILAISIGVFVTLLIH